MKTKETLISKADEWVKTLWHDAFSQWSVRSGQDKSYRWHVIHPAIVDILKKKHQDRNISILDLGCGDGVILDDQKCIELIGDHGAYLGVDLSTELLEKARERHTGKNIRFLHVNLSDHDFAKRIIGYGTNWDCVLSVFVVQEIPDIETFMENLALLLEKSSFAVIVTVHPDFADWLKETGKIQLADELTYPDENTPPWRWAGCYPIVDEPEETFYLPHFQRTIEDYRSTMEKFDIVVEKIIELPNEQHDLQFLVKQGLSPFTPFERNIYWPRIGEKPSTLAIIARKEFVSD